MMFLILLLGLALRLVSLNQSLWLDEATTAQVIRNYGLGEIVTKFSPGDFHPPFYYLLMKLWGQFFGTGEIALRVPSLIFALFTVYVVYLIGRELINKKTGLIASLLLATSGLHIYYSQEARMYALAAFLVSLLVYSFIKRRWVFFAIVLVLIGATDYPALLILPVFWILGRKYWRELVVSHLPLGVAFIVWFPIFSKQLLTGLGVKALAPNWWLTLGKTNLKELALIPTKFILGRISFDNRLIYALIAVSCGLLFGYLFLRARKNAKLLWFWLVIPTLLAALVGLTVSIFSYFRLLFVLPAFYLLIASGITTLKKSSFYLALVLVLGVNLLSSGDYLLNSRFHREDWRGLTGFVESKKTEKSVTLFVADSNMEAYRYYAPNARMAGPGAIKAGYDQVWLMRYVKDIFDPSDSLKSKVEGLKYKKVGEYNFNGVGVWEYHK